MATSARIFISFGIIFSVFTFLLGRLFFLQVVNNDKYTLLSDKNRIHTIYSVAPRGTIYDRNGKVLAISKNWYQAAIDLSQYKHSPVLLELLSKTLKLDKDELLAYAKKYTKTSGPTSIIPIKNQLTWDEILKLEQLSMRVAGLMVIPKITRVYQYGKHCCHCIGYVTPPSKLDVDKNANLKVLGATVGKMGIESFCDATLQGNIGIKHVEVNASRQIVRLIQEKPPTIGQSVSLTIDIELQKELTDIMKDVRCGSMIILDVNTGEVLACVSVPAFDPNVFTKMISVKDWINLIEDKDFPLINRAVSGIYAPGSVFKPVVALSAIKEGIMTDKTKFFCGGFYEKGHNRFHCHSWRYGGHGSIAVMDAIARSCDVFFYNVAVKLGASSIINSATDFCLGKSTHIELAEEKTGTIPASNKLWRTQDIGQAINLSIGQGQLSATPIQLVTMTARLATGKFVSPHMVKCAKNNDFAALPYPEHALNIVKKGMEYVVTKGTARNIQNNVISIAGKTGSTQVCKITKEERNAGKISRPYNLKDHAIFVGYTPTDVPRFAVVVVVEHGESGGRTAAPLGMRGLIAAHKYVQQPVS